MSLTPLEELRAFNLQEIALLKLLDVVQALLETLAAGQDPSLESVRIIRDEFNQLRRDLLMEEMP